MARPNPQWISVKLDKIHPTQITVGKREVEQKRMAWAGLGKKARAQALANHWFPGVLGPDGRHYIVDHHHFGLALLEEEVRKVSLLVLKDLTWLTPRTFWHVMDQHHLVHPYDNFGTRRPYVSIPKHLTHLKDDPYRSLAGEVRRAGGYSKDVEAYSEFLWADFLRQRIRPEVVKRDFTGALDRALRLARTDAARYLPGWTGPHEGS